MGSPYNFQLGTNARSANVLGDQFRLKLDPDIEAELDKLNYKLGFDRLQSLWYQPDWSVIDLMLSRPTYLQQDSVVAPSSNGTAPSASAPGSNGGYGSPKLTIPEPENPTLRKGEVSDVLKAVWRLPMIESAVKDMKLELETQWNRMGTGEKAPLITMSVIIGAGLIGGIAANQTSRAWALEKISGVDIPVPKVDGFSFSIIAPKGIIGGAGLQYESNLFNAKAAFEQTRLPDNTRFNNVSVTLNLNVIEAISLVRKLSR